MRMETGKAGGWGMEKASLCCDYVQGHRSNSAEEMILQAAGVGKKKVRGQHKAYEFRSSGTNVP